MSAFAPAILVFERRPRWESELKRAAATESTLVRPCRAAGDAFSLCRAMPGSVLILDLEVGQAVVLRLLEQLAAARMAVTPLVIAPASAADLEWPARELGATDFLRDTISREQLSQLCQRCLAVANTPHPAL